MNKIDSNNDSRIISEVCEDIKLMIRLNLPMGKSIKAYEILRKLESVVGSKKEDTIPTNNWIKVTEAILFQPPDWIHDDLWVYNRGRTLIGRYHWRQGRNPNRFYCEGGEDFHALDGGVYVMPLNRPTPPK